MKGPKESQLPWSTTKRVLFANPKKEGGRPTPLVSLSPRQKIVSVLSEPLGGYQHTLLFPRVL